MSNFPVFSIIVPVYNVGLYLERCIESILKQSFDDYEVILVDDGSTDNSSGICDLYSELDSRVAVIHKTNGGLSAARNSGLKIAKGAFICFIDSDDYVNKNLLETAFFYLTKYDVDSFRFSYSNNVDNNTTFKKESEMLFSFQTTKDRYTFLTDTFLRYKVGWEAWSCIYKRSIIFENDIKFFDNDKIYAEDLYFNIVYTLHSNSTLYLNAKLYNYCERDNSITKTISSFKLNELNFLSYVLYNTYFHKLDTVHYSPIHYLIISHIFRDKIISFRVLRKIRTEQKLLDNYAFFITLNNDYWKTVYKNIHFIDYFKNNTLYTMILCKKHSFIIFVAILFKHFKIKRLKFHS